MMKFILGLILGALFCEALLIKTYREELRTIKKECNQKVVDAWKIYRGVDIEITN